MTAATQPLQTATTRPLDPTTTRPLDPAATRPRRRTRILRPASAADLLSATLRAAVRLASTVSAGLRDLADAGQLGPDAEREVGRWSGGRI